MSIQSLMKDSVMIRRKTKPTGDWGDKGDSQDIGPYRGRLEPSSGRRIFRRGKEEVISTHLLYLTPCAVNEADRPVIGTEVFGILNIARFRSHFEIDLEKVNE